MACMTFDKPRGVTCEHLTKLGCGIHSKRMAECREYQCAWSRGSLDAAQRPDKWGIILSWVLDGAELHAAECRPGALKRHAAILGGIRAAYGVPVSEHEIGG
jgi:hypothetical protein